MIGVVIAIGAAALLLAKKKPARPALDAARANVRGFGAKEVLIKRMFAPVDQSQQPPKSGGSVCDHIGGGFCPSGGGWFSDAVSSGAGYALDAAKTYADAKTGGAVSKAETQIKSGDNAGAAYSYNAGITVAQPKK